MSLAHWKRELLYVHKADFPFRANRGRARDTAFEFAVQAS
jgi:hypothetical protein